jgi:hypothetical protein
MLLCILRVVEFNFYLLKKCEIPITFSSLKIKTALMPIFNTDISLSASNQSGLINACLIE